MDQDNQTLRWSLIVVGIVVVCFFLGYFILSPRGGEVQTFATPQPLLTTPTPPPARLATEAVDNSLTVTDITAAKEAEQRRKAEAERKRLEALQAQATPEPTDEDLPKDPDAEKTTVEGDKPVDADKPVVDPEKPIIEPDKPKDEKPKEEKPKEEKPSEPEKTKEADAEPKANFRVRVGGEYRSREEAQKLIDELRSRAIASTIKAGQRGGKTVYYIQIGAYSDKKNAERAKTMLESNGYDATIH